MAQSLDAPADGNGEPRWVQARVTFAAWRALSILSIDTGLSVRALVGRAIGDFLREHGHDVNADPEP